LGSTWLCVKGKEAQAGAVEGELRVAWLVVIKGSLRVGKAIARGGSGFDDGAIKVGIGAEEVILTGR
jgi:hypothetical protein